MQRSGGISGQAKICLTQYNSPRELVVCCLAIRNILLGSMLNVLCSTSCTQPYLCMLNYVLFKRHSGKSCMACVQAKWRTQTEALSTAMHLTTVRLALTLL